MERRDEAEQWNDGRDLVQDQEGGDVGDGGAEERGRVGTEELREAVVEAAEAGFVVPRRLWRRS